MRKILNFRVIASALFVVFCVTSQVAAQGADEVTFTKDVMPILQRSCQQCHRPGTGAPMSLLTFEEVRPWARAIKDRVVTVKCRHGILIELLVNIRRTRL
ncbi:MAG: hypothetical protein Ct9H300mP25_04800 [Acidobacteriota bacterium]|nr:MAG: hypothetical protein Ct9H300mP25_04800 [Acidobacteriota bacterium]